MTSTDSAEVLESAPAVEIRLLDDGYAAALYVSQAVATFPSLKQVFLAVERAKIIYGVNERVIEKLITDEIRGEPLLFAEGKRPTEGASARLIWNVGTERGAEPVDITDSLLKGVDENLFGTVKRNQQILSKLPPAKGSEGINVFGEKHTPLGTDIPNPQGDGTLISEDGLTLLAEFAGVATISDGKVVVNEAVVIDGSVDGQTGDQKIDSALYIKKDVQSGFRVEALGDIFIGGNIEGSDVYSRTGNIIVRNGIIGQSKARVLAGRSIIAGFIQDATVGAKLDVEAKRYIFNSAITAGRHIYAIESEGIVRGGTLFAECKIEIRVGGSDSRAATELRVGYKMPDNTTDKQSKLRSDQRRNRMELAYVQKRMSFLRLLKERMGELTEDKDIQLQELEKKEQELMKRHQAQHEKEESLKETEAQFEEKKEVESIRIHDKIYPDVTLAIGDVVTLIDKERTNIMFFRSGEKIRFGPLNQALAGAHKDESSD